MLHACFYTICLVFRYTAWRFYVTSGTNLLTRCHSASSLFSAIFVFHKIYTGNILEIGRNKFQKSYFSKKSIKDRTRARGPDDAPSPIKSLPTRNPKSIGKFLERVPQLCRRRPQILGDRSLCSGTLPGRGSALRAISISLHRPHHHLHHCCCLR
jgi:hypothetical protein